MPRRTSSSFADFYPDKREEPSAEIEVIPPSSPTSYPLEALSDDPLMLLIEQVGQLSAVDPRIALRQPLEQVVAATLDAACESPHSRRSYQNAIGLFVQYLDQRRGGRLPEPYQREWRPFAVDQIIKRRKTWDFKPPALILRLFVDASVLDGFRQWRLMERDAVSTVNQREYAVRTFLAVAYRDGILTHEQAQAMNIKSFRARRKAAKQTVGRRLAAYEVQALRAAVNTRSRKGKRDLAILDMMLFLGLRREEVTSILMENFVLDHGYWWLRLVGKGRKERKLKLPRALLQSLRPWLDAASLKMGTPTHYPMGGALFRAVNRGGRIAQKALSVSAINRLVAEYGHQAEIAPLKGAGRLSPHDLRRTAARTAYDQGASLLQVQEMLGHSTSQTTERYIGNVSKIEDTATDYIRY